MNANPMNIIVRTSRATTTAQRNLLKRLGFSRNFQGRNNKLALTENHRAEIIAQIEAAGLTVENK